MTLRWTLTDLSMRNGTTSSRSTAQGSLTTLEPTLARLRSMETHLTPNYGWIKSIAKPKIQMTLFAQHGNQPGELLLPMIKAIQDLEPGKKESKLELSMSQRAKKPGSSQSNSRMPLL